jgi:hypothetical protein
VLHDFLIFKKNYFNIFLLKIILKKIKKYFKQQSCSRWRRLLSFSQNKNICLAATCDRSQNAYVRVKVKMSFLTCRLQSLGE